MGLFDFFRKKKSVEERAADFTKKLIVRYIGSHEKLESDTNELLKMAKFNVSEGLLSMMTLRCLGFLSLKSGWNEAVLTTLRNDCAGRISDVDLKWLMVYVDVHYIHKNPTIEAALLFELGGRQMGMPSPSGDISKKYTFS